MWYELPLPSTGTVSSCPDGFYYVPILKTLQCLLSQRQVYDQVTEFM